MGNQIKKDTAYEYIQDNGETTAWFSTCDEKQKLSHKGSLAYKRLFYLLISAGTIYLVLLFLWVH